MFSGEKFSSAKVENPDNTSDNNSWSNFPPFSGKTIEKSQEQTKTAEKDQEIFDQIKKIEDPVDRDFAMITLPLAYDDENGRLRNEEARDVIPFVIEFANRDDKNQTWEEFYDKKNKELTDKNDTEHLSLFDHLNDVIEGAAFGKAYQIKRMASSNIEEHFDNLIASCKEVQYDRDIRFYGINANKNLSAEIISLANKELEKYAKSNDIEKIKSSEKIYYLAKKTLRPSQTLVESVQESIIDTDYDNDQQLLSLAKGLKICREVDADLAHLNETVCRYEEGIEIGKKILESK